jgi:hypothetical protein
MQTVLSMISSWSQGALECEDDRHWPEEQNQVSDVHYESENESMDSESESFYASSSHVATKTPKAQTVGGKVPTTPTASQDDGKANEMANRLIAAEARMKHVEQVMSNLGNNIHAHNHGSAPQRGLRGPQ